MTAVRVPITKMTLARKIYLTDRDAVTAPSQKITQMVSVLRE
jgi:hypothetical protein